MAGAHNTLIAIRATVEWGSAFPSALSGLPLEQAEDAVPTVGARLRM